MDRFRDAEAIGIVQYFPEWNNGAFERRARELLGQVYHVPIICGSSLFSDLNAIRRGAGTYLNIRLISMIDAFMQAVKKVIAGCGLDAPVYIVRSDGTLMSEAFARRHPIETLLCGPAASALGGAWLTGEENALVVDIGGTTTDIAILSGGAPVTIEDGILINGWKTFVKGLFVDTFGLGGDSAVRHTPEGIRLERFRAVPVAAACSRYPALLDRLQRRARQPDGAVPPCEGFLIQKKLAGRHYSAAQLILYRQLEQQPLFCDEAEQLIGKAALRDCIARLEQERAVIRFGLTPTDAMILRGTYTAWDRTGPALAVRCLSRISGLPEEQIPALILQAFTKKLYENIVRVLLEQSAGALRSGISPELRLLIENSFDAPPQQYCRTAFTSALPIAGVGAPAAALMQGIGERLGCRVVIPAHAGAANAIGTLAGRIAAVKSLEISYGCLDGTEGFLFYRDGKRVVYEQFECAEQEAEVYLTALAAQACREKGALGQLYTQKETKKYYAGKHSCEALMGGRITVTTYGTL